jgi:hypothetical protein
MTTPNPHREAGHTPGPWTAYEFGADWYVGHNHDDSGPLLRVGSNHAQREANARLIAKAPELLAQLDLIISEYLDGGVLNSSIEEAQDLLAQVLGESA